MNMAVDGLNTQYAVAVEGMGQVYPAIQATEYRPRSLKEKVSLCLSDESMELLSDKSVQVLSPKIVECQYSDEGDADQMWLLPDGLRFVVLGLPRLFCMNKETREVEPLVKGMRLAGTKNVTATKLILCGVYEDKLIRTDESEPQIFTLNLKSSKTALISGDRSNPEMKSIRALNDALLKHYKVKRSLLTHLVSVELRAVPRKFTSSSTNDTSMGIMFELVGNARPLTEDLQAEMFELSQSEEVKDLLADPFGVKPKEQTQESIPVVDSEFDEDEIAF